MGFTLDVQGQLCTFVFSDSALLLTVPIPVLTPAVQGCQDEEIRIEMSMSAVSCSKTHTLPEQQKMRHVCPLKNDLASFPSQVHATFHLLVQSTVRASRVRHPPPVASLRLLRR
jgi:hypothetical protein